VPGHLVFRVLGPLEVERDGSPLPLRGSKLRGLLGLLLLRVEQVMSQETLIDALWGDEPPPTARTALQMQVSRLRKLLEGDPAVSLDTTDDGYVLHLGPDRLDLDAFERLVAQGRSEMARGEHLAALNTLEVALELWRGVPFGNVDVGLPRSELARLEELELAARATRLEADLALGRHLDVVPELESLLTTFPLDERIHVLAAITLYRAGRQAEALDSITGLRHRLSTELGIEPGPAIRRLEEQILAQDPALDPPVMADDLGPRTARKTVAALVCRLTPDPSTSQDPEAGKAALDHALREAISIVEAHGGWMHEVILGRVTAIFGVPKVHEDDSLRAVRAAMELRAWSPPESAEETGDDGPRAARVGIALGEVLVESSRGKERLLSVGPVEEADQLARAARPGEVLMSGAAAKLVEHEAGLEPAEILLLGTESPLVAFRLVQGAPRGLEGRRFGSPLVARQEELAVLRQAFARSSRERAVSLVTLLGPAGVGKTRLVAEFLAQARENATVLNGRCLSYGREITFWPIAEMVRQAAGITESDRAHEARAKVARLIDSIEDAEFIEEQISSVLGLSGNPPVPGEIFWAIRRFFETVARDGSLVLVFDDIHWAETMLLDLIEHLGGASRGVPILVVCLARAELVEQRPGWGGGRLDATTLVLGTLGREESSRLIDNLFGSVEIDEEARERILEAGEGHPLFLEELVAMLIEDGELLRWQDGRWVASSALSEVPIPPTIQALIGARLDRLGAAQRVVLEHASVVGQEFTERNLAIFDPDPARLRAVLDTLEAKDLVSVRRESPTSGRTFRFRHHLIRDVAYRAMTKAARADAHEAFGDYLEAAAGARISEVEEIVGYHFEAAHRYRTELGVPDSGGISLADRSASRLRSAGLRALARDDNPAAVSLLRRAFALVGDDDPIRCELAWQLGSALLETGELDEAEALLEAGLRDARRLEHERAEWRIRLEQTDIRFWRTPEATNTQETERVAIEAAEVLRGLGDVAGVARAQRLLGDAFGRRGRAAEAVEAYDTSQRLAREAGDEREAAQRSNLGIAHGPVPVDRCIEIAERNLSTARRPDPEALAGLGFLLAMSGRFDESRLALEKAVARATELGVEWKLVSIHMHFGAAMLFADDPERAEEVLRPAVEGLQRMGEQSMFSTAVALLAEAQYRQGKLDTAMDATIASEMATADDDVASQMAWRGVRAKVLAARGEPEEAERLAREGIGFADRSDLINMVGDAHVDLGIVLQAAGKPEEAGAELQAAADRYRRKGNIASLDRVESIRASLHLGVAP